MVLIEDCCQNCGKVKASLYQCSQCKIVSYCSKNCEISHKKEHGNVCFTTPTTQNQNLDPSLEPEVTCSNKYNKPNKECLKESALCGEAETFCQTCYRSNAALQKCSRCKTVYYCSKMCQKSDWPTHQSNCKAPKTNSEVNCEKETGHEYSSERSNRKEPIKKNCVNVDVGNSGKTDRKVKNRKRNRRKRHKKGKCGNRKRNGTSSKIDMMNEISKKESGTEASKSNSGDMNCKGNDGGLDSEKEARKKKNSEKKTSQVNSKANIKETGIKDSGKKTDARASVKNTVRTCDSCGNSNENLMICSQCKNAKYCSKPCQRSAWPLHRKLCKSSNNLNTTSPRNRAGKCENCGNFYENLLRCSHCKNANYCSNTCQKSAWPLHKKCYHFNNTLFKAIILFPSHDIITKFINVKEECLWNNWMKMTLLVAYILKPGNHLFRPSVFIRDSDGCVKIVTFYHKEPDPRPYFSWEQLKTGNYICILQPELHYFLDGQIGFRINSIKEIRIL